MNSHFKTTFCFVKMSICLTFHAESAKLLSLFMYRDSVNKYLNSRSFIKHSFIRNEEAQNF